MGGGGQMSAPLYEKKSKCELLERVPSEKPPFTVADVRKAIPPHCFQRSILRSFWSLVFDLTIVYLFYYVATNYIHLLPHPLPYLAWPLYWYCQGSILTGVWVIGHECGHNAFSDYPWIDDTIGLILHSSLLVPYFSWKISHRRHHANTGSLDRDEVYVPKKKYKARWFDKYYNNPLGRVVALVVQLVLGFPLYLLFNVSGRPYEKFVSHFDPYGPLYTDRERLQIYISDAGYLAVIYGLYKLAAIKGFAWVFCVYGAPLLIVNGFFVTITFLHHTHPSLPRYDSTEWEWLRGVLSTVERDFGILNGVFHNVTITHVAHHMFPTIPHYHAMEATKAIQPVLGDYYQYDRTPILKALWREAKECLYVARDEGDQGKGVFWYRNKL